MYDRLSIKIVGQSGQGIDTIGKILSKAFKNCGFCVVGFREFPSLIKGGNSSFQVDISTSEIRASFQSVNIIVVLNEQQTLWHAEDLIDEGVIIHNIASPRFTKADIDEIISKKLKFFYIPSSEIVKSAHASPKMENIAVISKIWEILELPKEKLENQIEKLFKGKPQVIIDKNLEVCDASYNSVFPIWSATKNSFHPLSVHFEMLEYLESDIRSQYSLKSKIDISNFDIGNLNLLMNGNEALVEGGISAKVESFFAYPMTPSSTILTNFAELGEENGILVKQAEDEISAAGMAIGAMAVGERSLTATSGGGFDLMSEHISYAMIAEIPFVIILAQRPGPATGLATWTAQGDLFLSIMAGHGESVRIVLAVSDVASCFEEIQVAFNLADTYQVPVIILTDHFLAESYFTVSPQNLTSIPIFRNLVDSSDNIENLTRYGITKSGISSRWKVGSRTETYCINSDEHDENGNSTEDANWTNYMVEKRNAKFSLILDQMPDPEIISNNPISVENKIKIISWGSTRGVILDCMEMLEKNNIKVEFLHYTYLWPLKNNSLDKFIDENTVCIENNYSSQLAKLIKMETGIEIPHKALKYDGRPFFVDELYEKLLELISED